MENLCFSSPANCASTLLNLRYSKSLLFTIMNAT